MNGHAFTAEQDAWLQAHFELSRKELTDRFNQEFGTNRTLNSIKRHCIRKRILTGRTGRFEDGNTSWQTGITGEDYWSHFSDRTKAEVIERLSPKPVYVDGEVVEFPSQGGKRRQVFTDSSGKRQYRCMTGIIWEEANGPLSPDYRLIHLNGDIADDRLENLVAIPQSWMSVLASLGGLSNDIDVNKVKLLYCELVHILCENKRGKR